MITVVITVLNVLSVAFGVGATVLGLTPGEKWRDSRFTKKGWSLVGLAVLTAIFQLGIQLIQASEKQAAEAKADKIKGVVTNAYSGWVKVGTYSDDTWEKKFFSVTDSPRAISKGAVFAAGSEYAYFINIHTGSPGRCNPPEAWFKDTTANVLGRGTLVEVMQLAAFPCASGRTEVWAKIKPYL